MLRLLEIGKWWTPNLKLATLASRRGASRPFRGRFDGSYPCLNIAGLDGQRWAAV